MVLSRRRWRRASWSSWELGDGVKKGDGILNRCDIHDLGEKLPKANFRQDGSSASSSRSKPEDLDGTFPAKPILDAS